MKDIEEMLKTHTPKPSRPLPTSFTQATIVEINVTPRPHLLGRLQTRLKTRLLSKVGIASALGIVLISGTVAAITLWPQPTVTPTIAMNLPSGNHIVGYDAKNCNYFDELNSAPVAPTDDEVYYEVSQNSSLTDQQLQADLQAKCEVNISNAEVNNIVHQQHLNTIPGMMSTDDYTIQAISKDSITVAFDSHYSSSDHGGTSAQTYTHFTAGFLTYDESNETAYGSLKVGDEVVMVVQDASGKSEGSQNYYPLSHPESINILAIVKVPELTSDPYAFDSLIGTSIVRVETCKTSPTGFCRAYNFIN